MVKKHIRATLKAIRPKLRKKMHDNIPTVGKWLGRVVRCWQQRGFTALLVTHYVQDAVALADRVILIEDGKITLDQKIDLSRPRARGHPAFAELEAKILSRVLNHPAVAIYAYFNATREQFAKQVASANGGASSVQVGELVGPIDRLQVA